MILGGFINDNGDSNHNNVKKPKSNTNVACVARFLVHFFATYDHDVNFFIRRCLEGVSKFTMIEFFPRLGAVLKDSTPVKFICSFALLSKLESTQKTLKKGEFVLIVTYLLPACHQYLLNHPIYKP